MTQSIRAVYTDGRLRLLDPVKLAEGQEIRVVILSDEERVRAALSDLLVAPPEVALPVVDEAQLAGDVEAAFQNQPLLSETILAERRQGP